MSGSGERSAKALGRLARIGLNAAFPLRCRQCERLYAGRGREAREAEESARHHFGRLTDTFLCSRCAARYVPVQHPLCSACGLPFQTDHGEDHDCPDCNRHPPAYAAARAAGIYDRPLRTLIHQYKYQGCTELANPLGQLLWNALEHFYDPLEFDRIIPVPLHWFRRFRRGFNQAALLVRDWHQRVSGVGIYPNQRWVLPHVLSRRRPTSAQTGLGRQQRAANLKNAFAVTRRKDVRGKRILLVDDVMTTGATAGECTQALIRAGAECVKVLTVARAV